MAIDMIRAYEEVYAGRKGDRIADLASALEQDAYENEIKRFQEMVDSGKIVPDDVAKAATPEDPMEQINWIFSENCVVGISEAVDNLHGEFCRILEKRFFEHMEKDTAEKILASMRICGGEDETETESSFTIAEARNHSNGGNPLKYNPMQFRGAWNEYHPEDTIE